MYWILKKIKEFVDMYMNYDSHYLLWEELGPI